MYMQHCKHALCRHVPKTRLQGEVLITINQGKPTNPTPMRFPYPHRLAWVLGGALQNVNAVLLFFHPFTPFGPMLRGPPQNQLRTLPQTLRLRNCNLPLGRFYLLNATGGSSEVKLPTIGQMKKQRWEESEKRREEKRSEEKRREEKRKSQKKDDAGARKGRKVAKHSVFPMFWGSGGSKSRLAKAADAEPSGQMRDQKLHTVVARSRF